MKDIEGYYDTEYRIMVDSDEEDQLYQLTDGRKVFRLDHQAETLLRKLRPASGASILDYGCAKGGTLKRVLATRKDLKVHLFDVSETYIPFWRKFVTEDHWATYQPKESWARTFDVITSFFVLEHVADPKQMMSAIARLLKPGGTFYGIVPNTFTNTADFVVSDHVNHFSETSLTTLLEGCGFRVAEIDDQSHVSAYIVTAVAAGAGAASPSRSARIAEVGDRVGRIASYWSSFADRVREFERGVAGRPAAIYGSGFYGTFLATCLSDMAPVRCFVDQSPFRQGKTLLDRGILAPEALPAEVEIAYVGPTPLHARAEIAKVSSWSSRRLTYFYP